MKLDLVISDFHKNYLEAVTQGGSPAELGERLFNQLVALVQEQRKNKFKFEIFHRSVRKPFDYYQFGLDFIAPLIDFKNSKIMGLENVQKMVEQISRGENVILLANHQTEPDPQIINLLLREHFSSFVSQMIFIAGHRVIEDPMAIPMSMGCNLLCIYSKKHIDNPPSSKPRKVTHNQRTMQKMTELLGEGGKCIYVAPSGGRDRANAQGKVEVAPFDPQSIEMFWLMSQKSGKQTHFYPLALRTYDVMPPPQQVEKDLGERRKANHKPVYLAFGKEIEMEKIPVSDTSDKKEKRIQRAAHIWSLVNEALQSF